MEPSAVPPPPPPQGSRDDTFISRVVEAGAAWEPLVIANDSPVRKLKDIPYASESDMQKLDLYFPAAHPCVYLPAKPAFLPNQTAEATFPVLIHVHGGGWARGGKATWAHGAPSICKAAAANGMIAVSIGYRRGQYPDFVDDAARAVGWVRENIALVGGDVEDVFLSGHSAGAHIASLMVVLHDRYLKPHNVPKSFIKGLTLISGVYNLFAPLSKALLDVKNKGFVLLYVWPSFGLDRSIRREASPLVLLETDTDTSLAGKAAMAAGARGWQMPSLPSWSADPAEIEKERGLNRHAAETLGVNTDSLPPVLVFSAQFDVGLQGDGEKMSLALRKYTETKYVYVMGADHGSICRSSKTHNEMAEFMLKNASR